jgi:TPR repeat protein
MPRVIPRPVSAPVTRFHHLSTWLALRMLDSRSLGQRVSTKRLAGRLLKQPALQGLIPAQRRLGQLLCRDCGNPRDRRMGFELLRQAARTGDRLAQLELGQLYSHPRTNEPQQARYWLELAAAQGCTEACALLKQL